MTLEQEETGFRASPLGSGRLWSGSGYICGHPGAWTRTRALESVPSIQRDLDARNLEQKRGTIVHRSSLENQKESRATRRDSGNKTMIGN